LHGGNRLASTSLLEGLVFGSSVGDIVAADDDRAALMADRARQAIAHRLVTTVGPYRTTTTSSTMTISVNDAITREASAILTRLK
jgi:aspartate oxidase